MTPIKDIANFVVNPDTVFTINITDCHVRPEHNGLNNAICIVEFHLIAERANATADISIPFQCAEPDANSYTEFDDLTANDILSWYDAKTMEIQKKMLDNELNQKLFRSNVVQKQGSFLANGVQL